MYFWMIVYYVMNEIRVDEFGIFGNNDVFYKKIFF